ncbi:glyoxysomal processing protease, glyoxysomal isoform X2 [Euphorbia lathyris]|uniref:glyoxysomal processing protease, glyoxysomal isoform X2 n=1 Tax=Euphorbia lathyris TaxID=212925 RepID=UPI003313EBC9
MGWPETFDFARNFAVMVRVNGPDPKGMKMRKHAFHQYNSGKTTLSASGMLLPDTLYDAGAAKRILSGNGEEDRGLALIVTVASVVESFLPPQQRESFSQGRPEMIPGAQIDVVLESGVQRLAEGSLDEGGPRWITAQLIRLVDVPVSAFALQSLVESSSGSLDHGFEFGWSLATHDKGSQTITEAIQTQGHKHLAISESGSPSHMSKTTTRIAILGVLLRMKDLPNMAISPSTRRGDSILAVGSPFGLLSSLHFFNSLSIGSIANCFPARSCNFSLLMADMRCLPGMEGGPVFDEHAHLVGILIRPLRQKSSGAEIQLVIPWEAIATACSDLLLKEPRIAEKDSDYLKENLNAVGNADINESGGPLSFKDKPVNSPSPEPVEKAMASVCLITIDEGVWASGVLLNDQGLILTNAHLLEPWRFGKTTVNGGRNLTESEAIFLPPEEYACPVHTHVDSYQKSQSLLQNTVDKIEPTIVDKSKGYKLSLPYKGHKRIRIRLDHVKPWLWCDARVVYVSKGPLDVALMQLEYVPDQLCPIKVDITCPSLGSKAYVIGHGLFGPRCGIYPSVCSGVVAKIVKARAPPYYQSLLGGDSQIPAMLETTAAVHPGGSGGAVVNSEGSMVGLVTSNARHGGGTSIPHLNFSIPCALLEPIFKFAREMQNSALLQNLDQPNQQISSVWALIPPLSPKPIPPLPKLLDSLPKDDDKQEKGSKFAKFMAERNKILRSSTQFGKVDSISNEICPSKL